MIHLVCPTCKQTLEVENEGAGLVLPCPACAGQVTVPEAKTGPALRMVGGRSKSTAVQAGWICLGMGVLAFSIATVWLQRGGLGGLWVLYAGIPFLVVALICAVVALCTNQVWRGLAVLVGVVTVMALSGVVTIKAYQRSSQQNAQDAQQQLEQQLEGLLKQLTQ